MGFSTNCCFFMQSFVFILNSCLWIFEQRRGCTHISNIFITRDFVQTFYSWKSYDPNFVTGMFVWNNNRATWVSSSIFTPQGVVTHNNRRFLERGIIFRTYESSSKLSAANNTRVNQTHWLPRETTTWTFSWHMIRSCPLKPLQINEPAGIKETISSQCFLVLSWEVWQNT